MGRSDLAPRLIGEDDRLEVYHGLLEVAHRGRHLVFEGGLGVAAAPPLQFLF
jgi:hypothetical protein